MTIFAFRKRSVIDFLKLKSPAQGAKVCQATMKATVKQIFDYIQSLNPETNEISSMGEFVSQSRIQIAEDVCNECSRALPKDTLAYKVLTDVELGRFTTKQLWVIAYALVQVESFATMVGEFYAAIERKSAVKRANMTNKLASNKAATQSVLDYVKSNGRKLGDYYTFLKSNKKYAREFFSKKFTMESANEFLQLS